MLSDLAPEIIYLVAQDLDVRAIYALCRGSRRLYGMLTGYLCYREMEDRGRCLAWAACHGDEALAARILREDSEEQPRWLAKYKDALRIAASDGHAGIVEQLLRIPQLDPNSTNSADSGHAPIWVAAARGHTDVLRALLETGRADPNWADAYNTTALWIAAERGHGRAARVLLDFGADPLVEDVDGKTPVARAARGGELEIMRAFIQRDAACATYRSSNSWTPLMYAAEGGRIDVVQLLLEAGANTSPEDDEGSGTPLFWAAYAGRAAVVEMLLSNGSQADINTPHASQRTPLMVAASCGHEDVVRQLLDAGADVDSVNNSGMTALALAVKGRNAGTAAMLLAAGADPNRKDSERGNRTAPSRTTGSTPLARAAAAGLAELVEAMLGLEATDANACGDDAASPLVCAIANRQTDVVRAMIASRRVDVNLPDHELGQPLFIAIEMKTAPIFSLLLAAEGIDMSVKDRFGRTVWWAAFETCDTEILATMERSKNFQKHERFAASLMV